MFPQDQDLEIKIDGSAYCSVPKQTQWDIDYYLKKYLFEYRPLVEKIKVNSEKIKSINEEILKCSDDKAKENLLKELHSIEQVTFPVFDVDKIISDIWESNIKLKGAKKERLFLAGANDVALHLRKLLCPYD